MKKKVYLVCVFAIILSTITSNIIFYGYKKVEDFKDAEEEIYFLEKVILSDSLHYEDGKVLERILEDYSMVLNAGINVNYRDGSSLELNKKDKEVIYREKIKSDNNLVDSLRLDFYQEGLNPNYIRNLASAIIISIIIALFFISRFVFNGDEDYNKLIKAIQKNIDGKYNRLDFKSRNGRALKLEKKFNEMNIEVARNREEYKEVNTKLKSIISSMREGILALDTEGNIILSNDFAESILGLDKDSRSYKDIKAKAFFEVINIKGASQTSFEISTGYPNSKKIRVSQNPIKYYRYSNKTLGILFIFEDLTEINRLEHIREDFVANVSHELKTPLTSLLGFVETLKLGAIDDRDFAFRSLNIMEEEVIRMNSLVDDLLLLSEVESGNINLTREKIDLLKLIDEIFISLGAKADIYGVDLEKNICGKDFILESNENYLRQLIINLLSNSIKYNHEGGYVCITCSRRDGWIYIDVLDNGSGIDDQDQERIFERFYRGDKSRSSKIDGTGLGLAIVKHISSLLGGELSMESKKGIGTIVSVKIPVN